VSSPSPDSETIDVEVVCALPRRQWCVPLTLPRGSSVADALSASGLAGRPGVPDLDACAVGIWGEVVARKQSLRPGDRVEIYRALSIDPREARRRAAVAGRTLGRRPDGGGQREGED
jgi:putative ubiquitin-RnfH superfamily antitoxin RatB of RatAB toxin-antitoxin module